MPDRLPLLPGKTTPKFVEDVLSAFGHNPYGEPIYRLIDSKRKYIWFDGEVIKEYDSPYTWVLEFWEGPEKDAGSPEMWAVMFEPFLGPYPTQGTYNEFKQMPSDWYPTELHVQALCAGIVASKGIKMQERIAARKATLFDQQNKERYALAEAMEEKLYAAAKGIIQQSVSGPKNNFRTPEDWERDRDKALANQPVIDMANLPKRGTKLYQPKG